MAISAFSFYLILSLLAVSALASSSSNDLATEFLQLRSNSPSGVIHLNGLLITRILSHQPPPPFSLIIFFDAAHLHDMTELQLKTLRSEFALLSSSFVANNPQNPSLFFCDVELRESQSLFSLFAVSSLPHIRLIPANSTDPKSASIPMSAGDFSGLAESMAEFVESKTKVTVGPIHRPPIISKPQLIVMVCGFIVIIPFLVKKLIEGKTLLYDPRLWLAGAVFVYFFSVSGAMSIIIRKAPMFLADASNPSKLVFFYQGSGMQLGAEGFVIGFLYITVGLLLAFVTHGIVKVENGNVQRVGMAVVSLVSFWAVKEVVFLDNWKTGYGIHMYWPMSWW